MLNEESVPESILCFNNPNQNESGLPNHNVVPREGSSVSLCFLF